MTACLTPMGAAMPSRFATTADLMAVVERADEVNAGIHAAMRTVPPIDEAKALELASEWLALSERFLELIELLGRPAP